MADEPQVNPSPHEEDARMLLEQIRALMQKIKGYGFTAVQNRRRLIPAGALPTSYLLSVAVALDASPELARATGLSAADVRDAVSFGNAFGPVVGELKLAATGLEQTLQIKKGEMGQKCLKAYSMAKSFNRPSDGDVLVPHINDMKRTLNRGRRKPNAVAPDGKGKDGMPAKPAGGDTSAKPAGGDTSVKPASGGGHA